MPSYNRSPDVPQYVGFRMGGAAEDRVTVALCDDEGTLRTGWYWITNDAADVIYDAFLARPWSLTDARKWFHQQMKQHGATKA